MTISQTGPRKTTGTTSRGRKSYIYTDIPVKQALEEEEKNRNSKKNVKLAMFGLKQHKQNHAKRKLAKKRSKKDKDEDEDTSEEQDFCFVCMDPFRNSK